jgi:hypothetical protein
VTAGADALNKVEDVVWIAVHVKNDNIVFFADGSREFVEIGWKGGKLVDFCARALGEDAHESLAAITVRANESYR